MAVTAAEIKTQILAGSYPDNTLNENNVFDFQQYERRRRYPSCDIIVNNPPSTTQTQRDTQTVYGFQVMLYTKNIGVQSDEIVLQNTIENTITAQLESMTLQNHKIVLESKMWKREQFQRDQNHPAYLLSVLAVQVRQITATILTRDGLLTLTQLNGLNVTNISFDCFDTVLEEGYKHIEESVTKNPDGLLLPVNYTGTLQGVFSTNIVVKSSDLGATPEKLNQLIQINEFGYSPQCKFIYTDKTNVSSPTVISDTFIISGPTLQRLYRTTDNTVYRLSGRITSSSQIV